ncbi:hypothetical protein KUTeg_001952 [Tegillarca granosa]|uniref:Transporter n=1 Tax=Tegillarca granosa TaxID=220873 RepID=A0ABQ9FVN8_TEGGR|nr:hypothetical protein KUTeg_001952 [Tegillarca granosa]
MEANFDIADKMEGFIVIDTNSRTEDITDTSEYERETWSRKIEYLLSMVGYCVGLGNIWRFSYICLRNGGGAFLIPFLFFLITCGMPLYFLEVSIGQFLGKGVVYVSEVASIFRGLGFGMLVISVICAFYYNNITSWILYYLVNSFFNPLPWSTCGNSWNSKDCVNERYNAFSHMTGNANLSSIQSDLTILTRNSSDNTTRINNHFVTSEEEFWERQVLQMSSGLHDLGYFPWHLPGVKSAGKVVYVTATLPYLLLTVLIIRGLTLPGGKDGIAYYLKPNFFRLLDKQVTFVFTMISYKPPNYGTYIYPGYAQVIGWTVASIPIISIPVYIVIQTEDITDTSEYERETWSRKIQYLLPMVGYCVGLGNIWRFSYICLRNRGGAFLIPFLFFLITCGMSLYFFEVSIGQFLGGGVVYISEVAPIFRELCIFSSGLGFGMLVISVICAFYYNNITSWILYYLVNSFFNPLPWSTCGNSWNSKDCVNERYNAFSHMTGNANLSSLQSDLTILTRNSSDNTTRINNHFVTSEEEFWEYGVKSAGKVTATLPYLLLTVLIIRGLTLPGGIDGIAYYLKPNFLRLLDKQVWLEAALQVFYSLGPCWGGLITMSSYLKFSNNCLRDAMVLTLISEGTSLYGGMSVFAILGFMATNQNLPIDQVTFVFTMISYKPPNYGTYIYPGYAQVIGWTVASIPIISIPVYIVIQLKHAPGTSLYEVSVYKETTEGLIVIDTNSEAEDSTDTNEYKRETWNRKAEYLLSMVGYCVGLGNIWRFSYICLRNGGGAFLIPFLFFLITCGIPLFFLEVSVGQFLGKGAVYISEVAPIFRGLGFGMLAINVIFGLYYNIITNWILYYIVNSFFNPLPWSNCGNSWNTENCVNEYHMIGNANRSRIQSGLKTMTRNYSDNITWINNDLITSEEEFWERQVLKMSSGLHDIGYFPWHIPVCYLVAWIIIFLCQMKGVKSVGKVVYVTAILPYLLLTVLLIRGLTLPGGIDGIAYYLKPNFSRLLDKQVMYAIFCFSITPTFKKLVSS